MSLTGACQCGAVRYEVTGEPLGFARCHCTTCQAQSASAFGLSLYLKPSDLSIKGALSRFEERAASGNVAIRSFCPTCGTRLLHEGGSDYVSLKAGSLDPGHGLEPQAELWTGSKLPWMPLIDGVPRYEGQPPSQDELRAAWAAYRRNRTLEFYNNEASRYAEWSIPAEPHPRLAAFLDGLKPGVRVLDLGCGAGWAAAEMKRRGFAMRAMDGAEELAKEAKARHGINVEVKGFGELDEHATLDAVWAFFSLHHAPRDRMPAHLGRIWNAIVPGGTLYLGLIEGDGAARDDHGRLYTYYQIPEITRRLEHGGFTDIRIDRGEGKNFDGTPTSNLYVEATRA
ncbi:GFA family protein [Pontivivens insulae]|uniref:Methyltransferase domain-containing protein n=1 Tax=Pontivivens insulae TaxID=1639689 RepID=A0A2R8ABT2_9RHOB|nr:GFA family protein [Pontivivens insulae]RED11129.1 hypothetical protein DFR53_3159 [Pontivivens insulae]SPF29696.1 hypothetical protein POI8812_02012 [Pontivivens insulae]